MAGHLDFYFFYGSIHSYLSVMRIGARLLPRRASRCAGSRSTCAKF
jgi:hypothetical protein